MKVRRELRQKDFTLGIARERDLIGIVARSQKNRRAPLEVGAEEHGVAKPLNDGQESQRP
jgi:hypothetical protein